MAEGEAEADVEAPTRGAAAREMRFLTVRVLRIDRADRRGRGEPERAGTLFAEAGRSVGPRGAPKLGSVPSVAQTAAVG